MKRIAAVVAALVSIVPAGISARDRWESQVRLQLAGVALAAAADGYRLNEQLQVGSLAHRRLATLDLTFQGGVG